MSTLLFDSRDLCCKSPFGAVRTGEETCFSVFLPVNGGYYAPRLLVYEADAWDIPVRTVPMQFAESDGVRVRYTCTLVWECPRLLFYLFETDAPDGLYRICRADNGNGILSRDRHQMWQLTVYDAALQTPDFLKQGIMYQIFPDRFSASGTPKQNVPTDRRVHTTWGDALPDYLPDKNGEITNSDYFGGDLAGILSRLPYLKELGVSVLYLNPIFEAHSNHRYDTADYEKIDPLLGNEADLTALCDAAHKLGMHVVLDGVFNHTGSDSRYFNKKRRYGDNGAYNDPNSPYCSWYEFTSYPQQYSSWWGFPTLPSLNETDPSYSEFICGENGVLAKWIKAGISGWRLDVADELPDAFLDQICARIRATDPQAAVIGEVWEDASTKIAYSVRRRYLLGKQLDSVMNYPFKDAILSFVRHGNGQALYDTIALISEHYPKPVRDVLMNSLSTHDVERAVTALAGEPIGSNGREWQAAHHQLHPERYIQGKRLFRLASLLQYTLPGIPCLYYGDEAGLCGYKDPFNRTCYPWGQEDAELLEWFRTLGKLRSAHPHLSDGEFTPVCFADNLAVYIRRCGACALLVAVNRGDKARAFTIPPEFSHAQPLFGELNEQGALPPLGYAVFEVEKTN